MGYAAGITPRTAPAAKKRVYQSTEKDATFAQFVDSDFADHRRREAR
jgi:hypothetical protein